MPTQKYANTNFLNKTTVSLHSWQVVCAWIWPVTLHSSVIHGNMNGTSMHDLHGSAQLVIWIINYLQSCNVDDKSLLYTCKYSCTNRMVVGN